MNEFHPDIAHVLVTEKAISNRVKELARQLERAYADAGRIYLIGILKGAFIFLADLTRELSIPHTVDFMAVSSYGKSGTSAGEVRLVMDLREPITGQHVVIVEDIIDSGQTLSRNNFV